MANNIRLQDFGAIYDQGLVPFIQKFLKKKVESGESLVYSIEGKIIELNASDVLWVYEKFSKGAEPWEIEVLNKHEQSGEPMVYSFSNQTISIPAKAVLDLLNRIKESNEILS